MPSLPAEEPTALDQLIQQFQLQHNRRPAKIVVTKLALLALCAKNCLLKGQTDHNGVSIICREFFAEQATQDSKQAMDLGVFVTTVGKETRIAGCALK